jgi:hypothetical protein
LDGCRAFVLNRRTPICVPTQSTASTKLDAFERLAKIFAIVAIPVVIPLALAFRFQEEHLRNVLSRIAKHPINCIEELLRWNLAANLTEESRHAA